MARNAVFLSGWEYNLVTDADPLAEKPSSLPAEVLWNGCAQFWLFRQVYCSDASLKGELASADALGWATSRSFIRKRTRSFWLSTRRFRGSSISSTWAAGLDAS